MGASLTDLLFPPKCAFCGAFLPVGKEKMVCDDCVQQLPLVETPACPSCGCDVRFCRCRHQRNLYEGVVAPFYFHGLIRESIHRFKFRGRSDYAHLYAGAMQKCVEREYEDIRFDGIQAVPMTEEKRLERGYNQAALLAEDLAERMEIPYINVMIKRKDTSSQHNLGFFEREHNLEDAYRVLESGPIRNKCILLVDDVKTTGSTLNECAYTLRRAGASHIYAVCFAVTPPVKEEMFEKILEMTF